MRVWILYHIHILTQNCSCTHRKYSSSRPAYVDSCQVSSASRLSSCILPVLPGHRYTHHYIVPALALKEMEHHTCYNTSASALKSWELKVATNTSKVATLVIPLAGAPFSSIVSAYSCALVFLQQRMPPQASFMNPRQSRMPPASPTNPSAPMDSSNRSIARVIIGPPSIITGGGGSGHLTLPSLPSLSHCGR